LTIGQRKHVSVAGWRDDAVWNPRTQCP
jgi:hypothetical protein